MRERERDILKTKFESRRTGEVDTNNLHRDKGNVEEADFWYDFVVNDLSLFPLFSDRNMQLQHFHTTPPIAKEGGSTTPKAN